MLFAIISRLYQVVWLSKRSFNILELIENLSSVDFVISRHWSDENGCELYSNEKTLLKSPKSAVLHCGIFELGTLLLPLSSWLLQLPNVTRWQLLEPTRRSFKEKICIRSVAIPSVSCRFCSTQSPTMFERSRYAKWKDQTRGHPGFFRVWPSTPAGQRSPSFPENKLTNRCLVCQD